MATKFRFALKVLFSFFLFFSSQAQLFTWKSGSNVINQSGVYGQMGVSSTTNVPGSRSNAYTWKDKQGNFWLYGGFGYDKFGNYGNLADLWKYIPSNNSWAWMKGDSMCNKAPVYGTQGFASPANTPGSRYLGVFWTDTLNNLWLYGSVNQSDIWKFSPASNNWTWIGGSTNANQLPVYGPQGVPSSAITPGNRYGAAFSADGLGNLWLFGGSNRSDLWMYNVVTLQWTFVKGSTTTFTNSVYGSLGLPSATVFPGARIEACLWTDANNIWVYGGNGMDAVNPPNQTVYLNDLWKYDISGGQWTWMRGATVGDQYAVQGVQDFYSATNEPGGRVGSVQFKDSQGKFWLFGGIGFMNSSAGYLCDIWQYDPAINQWNWRGGAPVAPSNGVYGTQGIASNQNYPGGRIESQGWMDADDNLWIFGGYAYMQSGMPNTGNDLWLYSNCSAKDFTLSASTPTLCAGASLTLSAAGAGSYTWAPIAGTNSIIANPTMSTTYSVLALFDNACIKTKSQLITVYPQLSITAVASATTICNGESVIISAAGASNYTCLGTAFTSSLSLSPTSNTTYTIIGSTAGYCDAEGTLSIQVDACTGISNIGARKTECSMFPNPATTQLVIDCTEPSHISIINASGALVFCTSKTELHITINVEDFAKGIYSVRILNTKDSEIKRLCIDQ